MELHSCRNVLLASFVVIVQHNRRIQLLHLLLSPRSVSFDDIRVEAGHTIHAWRHLLAGIAANAVGGALLAP